jgi:hypothetical protein
MQRYDIGINQKRPVDRREKNTAMVIGVIPVIHRGMYLPKYQIVVSFYIVIDDDPLDAYGKPGGTGRRIFEYGLSEKRYPVIDGAGNEEILLTKCKRDLIVLQRRIHIHKPLYLGALSQYRPGGSEQKDKSYKSKKTQHYMHSDDTMIR